MPIPQHRRRLILVVIIALFLGTAAEEASTQRISTFVTSAVSEWLDEAFPLETPALDEIPVAVTAGAASGTPSGRLFPTSPTASPNHGGAELEEALGLAGSVLPRTQALDQTLAFGSDGNAPGSTGSFAAGAGGQAGRNSRRSGTGAAAGGASGGAGTGGASGVSSTAANRGNSPSDTQVEAASSPSAQAGGPASGLAERETPSADGTRPSLGAQSSGRGEPDTLSAVAPPTLLPSGPGLTSADRVPFNPEFNWSLPTELETSPALSPDLPLAEPATLSSTIAAIPEPGTLMLFGTGLMALAIWSRARVRRVSRAVARRDSIQERPDYTPIPPHE